MSRGLLAVEKVKHLLVFTTSRYALPSGTTDGIPAPTEAAALIQACERDRADLWRSLNDDTWRGIKSRYRDPDPYDYGFDD